MSGKTFNHITQDSETGAQNESLPPVQPVEETPTEEEE